MPRLLDWIAKMRSLLAGNRALSSRTAKPLRGRWTFAIPKGNRTVVRARFAIVAAALDIIAITLSAVVVGDGYHAIVYNMEGFTGDFLKVGLFMGLLFVVANIMRHEYAIANYLTFSGHFRRSMLLWNVVSTAALAFGFITKTTADFSRGAIVIYYVVGFIATVLTRAIIVPYIRASAEAGGFSTRRVFLVGDEAEINAFSKRYEPAAAMTIVAAAVMRGAETLRDDLVLAAASARMLRPDDVFILIPWSQTETIDACINAFMSVPAAIHLGPEHVLGRFVDAHISKIGGISSLNLVRSPLGASEILVKRIVDIIGSALGLILLLPLFLLVAAAIKLDSKGPVFFLQRRYGFNQEPFRIVKFRSMTTIEDDASLVQVKKNDLRITRMGQIIRRFNIDELPQLLNVLRGDMSLVGPRPHALAHDQLFERTIALYARRHNVKPGITGWAQVNGLRGETDTEEKIRRRVEHDLYYIDNWSFWLDMRIICLTVFSRKAYRNAY
jgi:Undecaprenyl-phosphate glucose phosphotransferase